MNESQVIKQGGVLFTFKKKCVFVRMVCRNNNTLDGLHNMYNLCYFVNKMIVLCWAGRALEKKYETNAEYQNICVYMK